MIRYLRGLGMLMFVALLVAFAAPARVVGAAEPDPLLRLVYAAPNGPAVDIYVDGQRKTTASQFGEITPYLTVTPGTHQIQVFAASAGPAGAALLDTQVTFQSGQAYSVLATDRVEQMSAVVLNDALTIEPGASAYVRLVHLSPDAPPVADVAVTGGATVASNLPFKGATAYLPITPGTYRFDVRPAGAAVTLATTAPLTLAAGQIYTVFVMGQLADNTFQALITPDNARSGGVGGVPSTGGGGMAATGTALGVSRVGLPLAALGVCLLGAAAWRRRGSAAVRAR